MHEPLWRRAASSAATGRPSTPLCRFGARTRGRRSSTSALAAPTSGLSTPRLPADRNCCKSPTSVHRQGRPAPARGDPTSPRVPPPSRTRCRSMRTAPSSPPRPPAQGRLRAPDSAPSPRPSLGTSLRFPPVADIRPLAAAARGQCGAQERGAVELQSRHRPGRGPGRPWLRPECPRSRAPRGAPSAGGPEGPTSAAAGPTPGALWWPRPAASFPSRALAARLADLSRRGSSVPAAPCGAVGPSPAP